MTGTALAQAIPVALSPILARMYTPEDFGLSALFFALVTIFGSISSGKYELAIMLPEKDEDAINIFAIGFILISLISTFLLIIALVFNSKISLLLGNPSIGIWLYFVPLVVFITGLYNILLYFNTRRKKYKDIANSTILKSIISVTAQLIIGFLKKGVTGLITGQILAQLFANMKLIKNITNDKVLISNINKTSILQQAKKYKNFPKYSVWAGLANTSSQQLTSILISSLFSIVTLGYYSLVNRVLSMPSSLIGSSIGHVFFQEATDEKLKFGKINKTFNGTIKKLVFIGLPVFTFLFFIIEDLFIFVFGSNWFEAGLYAKILIPLFFCRFISSSLSSVLIIFEKQKMELVINLILLLSSIVLIYSFDKFTLFLSAFSFVMSANYILFLGYYYKLSFKI